MTDLGRGEVGAACDERKRLRVPMIGHYLIQNPFVLRGVIQVQRLVVVLFVHPPIIVHVIVVEEVLSFILFFFIF